MCFANSRGKTDTNFSRSKPEGKLCSERNKDETQETVRSFCRHNRLCGVVSSRAGASAERGATSHFAGGAGGPQNHFSPAGAQGGEGATVWRRQARQGWGQGHDERGQGNLGSHDGARRTRNLS